MTDGIRLLALDDQGADVDVTDQFSEPADDGYTGETMQTTSEAEKTTALRLAREALSLASREMDMASRRFYEADLAVMELTGETPYYAALLRARYSGDEAAHRSARIEFYADLFLSSGTRPPDDISYEVTERVAALLLERENAKH